MFWAIVPEGVLTSGIKVMMVWLGFGTVCCFTSILEELYCRNCLPLICFKVLIWGVIFVDSFFLGHFLSRGEALYNEAMIANFNMNEKMVVLMTSAQAPGSA
eukprot:GHVN01042174.1.p2 GENE.GHVN01042174.1~~GHVN01042174.1.p2  ORF type:complete len:102 (+),score=7.70 GHVN01042174.1:430-735(+)